ncbi:hypothetical protein KP509_07G026900 [Ceratopteris richardii]|uniref:Reverse transcriptase Ty1/copia-type domain-containing protein n=1 Tax=Ceratopteris richardii TaxID=49495 RepID=A0A8T2UCY6_CERRI|nr:hypothetical protein KP509_07G026900 [Ceratopteris richardii]
MLQRGYLRLQSDPNIYRRHTASIFLLLAIYVDDILLLCNDNTALSQAKQELCQTFSMTDMGSLQYCLGIQVDQHPVDGYISMHQSSYVHALLTKFHMEASKGVATPLPLNLKMPPNQQDSSASPSSTPYPYANILGCLRYLIICTRPDLCYATNYLSRFLQHPGAVQIQHLKRVLRYLRHTSNYGLLYKADSNTPSNTLIGYSDADWGGDEQTKQSLSGFTYLLSNAAISWQSKKEEHVTLFSTEAEYVSMTLALKEGMWLKTLLEETQLVQIPKLTLHCDNMSAIMLASNLKDSEKTKNIALKLQFIRELVADDSVHLQHVGTDSQWADFLTKSLNKLKDYECCKHLGICPI